MRTPLDVTLLEGFDPSLKADALGDKRGRHWELLPSITTLRLSVMLRLVFAAPVHRHPDRRLARSRWASPYLAIWIALTFAFAALALWHALPPEQLMGVIAEGGPMEQATEYFYFATAVGMWLLRRPGESLRLWTSLFVTLVAFGAREMDLHKAWTGLSVLKVSFYLGSAPSSQKLVAFGVVLTVILAMGYLLVRHGKPAWRALLDRNPIGVTVACFVATLVVSKVLDRAVNVLAEDFQIFSPPGLNALVWAVEEVLELCLPVLAATGLLQHRLVARHVSKRRSTGTPMPSTARTSP